MELEIKEKAWVVKDPTVYEFTTPDQDWQIVYAATSGAAKTKCTDYSEYMKIQVLRSKPNDKVIFEGNVEKREDVEERIRSRKIRAERTAKVMRFSEADTFYVQHGYCGNAVMWWGKGSCGYTSNLDNAQVYTREEILDHFIGKDPVIDRIWLSTEVEKKIQRTVDSQYLDHDFVS